MSRSSTHDDDDPTATGRRPGRPRGRRNLDDFTELGPPPADPLELARWAQRALALDLHRALTGRDNRELSQTIRATANAIVRALPVDTVIEARRLLRDDQAGLSDTDPDVPLEAGGDMPALQINRGRR